ncbi:hypothetical protein [Roseicitreum antarcticum]|uniref:B30.2/SPRY domain-containing protein n=1 Tax=Roseicitreum antarcticum TaxID=564137 RepID=A0A1H3EYA0_9RHOB|nr:hypothetical protein [Roseicitreum antarcticum]SDX82894.1 hypothetical protein SAMN04488238_12715 [Roseicitreum antarcticum]
MSLLMMRAAILAQGGAVDVPPPPDGIGDVWALDATRRPAGYTLSDDNQTAINTSGGNNYLRWVPTERAILPSDARRYWEVICAASGSTSFDGYMGVISAAQREEYNAGLNPITRGSIGWRGNGTIWSSDETTGVQRVTGLPGYGAGDTLMFVFDPAGARLWIGKNGIWITDPISDPPVWSAGASPAFYPHVQGRGAGDGGTLRSLPAQFSYPTPPGVPPLGMLDPDLRIFQSHAFLEIGWDRGLSVAELELWRDLGGATNLTLGDAALYIEMEIP